MDLPAYLQIDSLAKIAEENGIKVPRLRGYRLMRDESLIDIKEFTEGIDMRCLENLCCSHPFWNPNSDMHEYSEYTKSHINYYSYDNKIRWDRICGKKRKVLKTYIHNEYQKAKKQVEIFNKYVGREDILYIHARIGGDNWEDYHSDVDRQSWFIEKVDDFYDNTYCDIYAKINNTAQAIKSMISLDKESNY